MIVTMTSERKAGSELVIVPECFSGEGSYEDWVDQFESIVDINHRNE